MSDTSFTNGVTVSDADWFNDVNRLHYTIFGDPSTARAALDALYIKGSDVASATTTDLTATTGDFVHITGTTTITAITLTSGDRRYVVFDGILTLTHNATTLILPGGANITTAAGDCALFTGDGVGNTRCLSYVVVSNTTAPPYVDTNALVKGSADATKQIRFEVDGLTTGTTRVLTVADLNSAIGKQPTRQTFTSGSGTYTTATGATRIYVRLVGAGGGGGGSGTGAPTGGGTGGNTTFSTLTGSGGGGGSASTTTTSSAGGAAAGGDLNIPGAAGGGAAAVATSTQPGCNGASSPFGGAGPGGPAGVAGIIGVTNTGGGGGGGGGNTGVAYAGGGASGGYVEKTITAPAATYSYGVGAAGTAGGAGTSGFAGAAGGSGIVIVDEYYN